MKFVAYMHVSVVAHHHEFFCLTCVTQSLVAPAPPAPQDVNTFAMRVREWYCWHFPELRELVSDNYMFARCAEFIGDRATFTEDKIEKLGEIVMDAEVAKSIHKAAQSSMGMNCSEIDMRNIMSFTTRMVKLAEYRKQLHEYLQEKMQTVAPNLGTLVGDMVAARLISKAGSLTSLAKCPASTVQILGAEKVGVPCVARGVGGGCFYCPFPGMLCN